MTPTWTRFLPVTFILIFILSGASTAASAYPASLPVPDTPPFGLPFQDPPGPDTWLLAQPYGNTTGAYRNRSSMYNAGQGIHFGVDLSARCGTPIVAIGDGVVAEVDNLNHGAAPHNLLINHPNGYASFYGHLLEKPDLIPGQPVQRGQVIAKSGDPDQTCTSRPHLHLEIRNAVEDRGAAPYTRAYNPLAFIDADWETIALSGSAPQTFERDLSNPRRWQRLLDQPETAFWGLLLNDYDQPWPPNWRP